MFNVFDILSKEPRESKPCDHESSWVESIEMVEYTEREHAAACTRK